MPKIISLILLFCFFNLISYSQSVFVTPYGKKFHKGDCRMVNNVSKQLTQIDAINEGYLPCKICNPPTISNSLKKTNIARGKGNTVQCNGRTKNGTRCQHKTTIANGFCFQHSPEKKRKR